MTMQWNIGIMQELMFLEELESVHGQTIIENSDGQPRTKRLISSTSSYPVYTSTIKDHSDMTQWSIPETEEARGQLTLLVEKYREFLNDYTPISTETELQLAISKIIEEDQRYIFREYEFGLSPLSTIPPVFMTNEYESLEGNDTIVDSIREIQIQQDIWKTIFESTYTTPMVKPRFGTVFPYQTPEATYQSVKAGSYHLSFTLPYSQLDPYFQQKIKIWRIAIQGLLPMLQAVFSSADPFSIGDTDTNKIREGFSIDDDHAFQSILHISDHFPIPHLEALLEFLFLLADHLDECQKNWRENQTEEDVHTWDDEMDGLNWLYFQKIDVGHGHPESLIEHIKTLTLQKGWNVRIDESGFPKYIGILQGKLHLPPPDGVTVYDYTNQIYRYLQERYIDFQTGRGTGQYGKYVIVRDYLTQDQTGADIMGILNTDLYPRNLPQINRLSWEDNFRKVVWEPSPPTDLRRALEKVIEKSCDYEIITRLLKNAFQSGQLPVEYSLQLEDIALTLADVQWGVGLEHELLYLTESEKVFGREVLSKLQGFISVKSEDYGIDRTENPKRLLEENIEYKTYKPITLFGDFKHIFRFLETTDLFENPKSTSTVTKLLSLLLEYEQICELEHQPSSTLEGILSKVETDSNLTVHVPEFTTQIWKIYRYRRLFGKSSYNKKYGN